MGPGVDCFSRKPLEKPLETFHTHVTPLKVLLWIYSNSIFPVWLQSVAACVESKGDIFYFYFISRRNLSFRTSRNQHPQNTLQNNSLKLKLKWPLKTVQVVWSIPRIDWVLLFCLGLKHMEQEKFKSSAPSAKEGRKTYCILHSAHCHGPLMKFYSELTSISWEQLFIKGMDNSIDCYKFDWLNRKIGTVSPSLPAICFFLNIWQSLCFSLSNLTGVVPNP